MKFNVGDKVRIKENLNECEFGCNSYMRRFIGEKATVVNIFRDNILLDIDGQMWYWSENVLELIKENNDMNIKIEEDNKVKMKRIDYIMNSKSPIQSIEREMEMNCDICPGQDCACEKGCSNYLRQYLEQEIEVNESDLKDADTEPIDVNVEDTDGQIDCKEVEEKVLDEVKEQLLKTKGKIIDMEEEPVENDPVNHPSHYTDTKIEVMDYIEDKGFNFALGNAVKYISRAGKKDKNKTIQDLEKAEWYLNREIERLKKLQTENN